MRIDIKHTEDGDIDFSGGDIFYDESTAQHQRDLLLTSKGELKESPERGIGSINYLNENSPADYLRAIRQEFTRDGMKIQALSMIGGNLKIKAEYGNN